MESIEINDIGPIQHLTIPLPTPGVYVLKGTHGLGKSTALETVSAALGEKSTDLSIRDGAKRGGMVFGDATLAVTKSRTALRGELEVLGIQGRLDINDLVDPGIIDQEKADAKRVKTLVGISGVKPNPELFYEIAGGAEAYKALGVDDKTDDPLLLAARIKRAIEAQARLKETAAEKARADATASRVAAEGIDTEAESDEQTLADAQEKAGAVVATMKAHNNAAAIAKAAAENAAKQLAEMEASAEDSEELGELLSDARVCQQAAIDGIISRNEKIAEFEREISAIQQQIEMIGREQEAIQIDRDRFQREAVALEARIEAAAHAAEQRQRLADNAAASVPTPHTPEAIAAAEEAAAAARVAVQAGSVVRHALAKLAEAEGHAAKAKTEAKAASRLRAAALAVDEKLSDLLPADCPLRVEKGRLVIRTDRSESELFSELSHGEKWQTAIKVAAATLPPDRGLLTLAQEAWEGQSPAQRLAIHAAAVEANIVILTAQVTDDAELTVEALGATNAQPSA